MRACVGGRARALSCILCTLWVMQLRGASHAHGGACVQVVTPSTARSVACAKAACACLAPLPLDMSVPVCARDVLQAVRRLF